MNSIKKRLLRIFAFATCAYLSVQAAEEGGGLPKLFTVIREQVKPGHKSAHAKNEHEWAAAFEKAKHPFHYMAMTSMTGADEAWYFIPYKNHAQMDDDFKRVEDNPLLKTETEHFETEDGQHISGVNTIHLSLKSEFTVGKFPAAGDIRYVSVECWHVRPGYWSEFEAGLKAFLAARERGKATSGSACYEVTGGMAGPVYVFLSPATKLADLDSWEEEFMGTMGAATDEERGKMFSAIKESVTRIENNLFQIDPKQSYVSEETKNAAPEFWNAK